MLTNFRSAFSVRKPTVFSAVLIAGVMTVFAQTRPPVPIPVERLIKLDDLEAEGVVTPEYDVNVRGGRQRDGRMEWLRLKLDYELAKEWTDQVTVTYYVVLQGDLADLPKGTTTPLNMFTGSVTYVNLRKGDQESTMFLDPNTFARYGKIKAVGAEVTIEGRDAGFILSSSPPNPTKWWDGKPTESVPLKNRSETPWALVEIEKHATIQQ